MCLYFLFFLNFFGNLIFLNVKKKIFCEIRFILHSQRKFVDYTYTEKVHLKALFYEVLCLHTYINTNESLLLNFIELNLLFLIFHWIIPSVSIYPNCFKY